jgi:hypothetical protein
MSYEFFIHGHGKRTRRRAGAPVCTKRFGEGR